MTFDAHKNLAYSRVSAAPSPALSGTSLTVSPGQGALFPVAPFNCTVWPNGVLPLQSNAEIIRVTNVVGDTLTIVRAQEGTTAKPIAVGYQIANTISAKVFTDIENSIIQEISAGTAIATASQVIFSNANGVSFGASGQTITASVNTTGGGGGSINFSAGTTSNNLSAVTFSNANGLSFGLNAGVITGSIASVSAPPVAAGASNGVFTFLTIGFSNANNVTFGTSAGNIITASVGAGTQSTQPVAASAANGSFLFSTIYFVDSGNVSWSTHPLGMLAHVPASSNASAVASASNGSFSFGTIRFSNANGITFGTSAGNAITASVGSSPGQSTQPVAASASNGSFLFSTLAFSNANNVTFGTSAGSIITASVSPSAQTDQPVAASASNGSFLFSTLAFSNANNITFGTSAGSIITASLNPADLGAVTLSYFDNGPIGNNLAVTNGGSRYMGVQFIMPEPISISFIRLPGRMTCQGGSLPTTSSSGSAAMAYFSSYRFGIYSNGTGASSQSLMSVASSIATSSLLNSISVAANGSHYTITHRIGFGLEGNAASFSTSYASTAASYTMASSALSNYAGTRMLDFDFANSLPAGNYWLFFNVSSATSTTDARFSNLSIFQCSTLQFYGISQQQFTFQSMGAAITEGSVVGGSFGMGSYQPGGTLPAGIPYSGISSAPSYVKNYFEFRRSA